MKKVLFVHFGCIIYQVMVKIIFGKNDGIMPYTISKFRVCFVLENTIFNFCFVLVF